MHTHKDAATKYYEISMWSAERERLFLRIAISLTRITVAYAGFVRTYKRTLISQSMYITAIPFTMMQENPASSLPKEKRSSSLFLIFATDLLRHTKVSTKKSFRDFIMYFISNEVRLLVILYDEIYLRSSSVLYNSYIFIIVDLNFSSTNIHVAITEFWSIDKK